MAYGIELFKVSDINNHSVRDIWVLEKDDYARNYHRVEDGKYCVLMGRYGDTIRIGDALVTKSQMERSCKRALEEGGRVFSVPDLLWFKFPKSILVLPEKQNMNAHKTVARKTTPARKPVKKSVRRS